MPRQPSQKAGIGTTGSPRETRVVAEYSFATSGGAVSAITLPGEPIPSGAIILSSLLHVDTVPVGAGASIAINAEAANDIVTAAAISGAPWSTTGAKRGTLTGSTAPVKTTAVRQLVATISGAVLTAGRFRVIVTYIEVTP